MFSDVNALCDILQFLVEKSFFFRVFIVVSFVTIILHILSSFFLSRMAKRSPLSKEDKKDEV